MGTLVMSTVVISERTDTSKQWFQGSPSATKYLTTVEVVYSHLCGCWCREGCVETGLAEVVYKCLCGCCREGCGETGLRWCTGVYGCWCREGCGETGLRWCTGVYVGVGVGKDIQL